MYNSTGIHLPLPLLYLPSEKSRQCIYIFLSFLKIDLSCCLFLSGFKSFICSLTQRKSKRLHLIKKEIYTIKISPDDTIELLLYNVQEGPEVSGQGGVETPTHFHGNMLHLLH